MKRYNLIISIFILFVISISLSSAISLDITSETIVNKILNDADEPAKFDFTILNKEDSSEFEIFTYEKFDISPNSFSLDKGKAEKIRLEFTPIEIMKENSGFIQVPIYFREKGESETVSHQIIIELVEFKDSFSIKAENIDLDSEKINIAFYNIKNITYDKIDVVFSSSFTPDKLASFSISPFEKKEFEMIIDKDKLKKLVYGSYLISATIDYKNWSEIIYGNINIREKALVSENTYKTGILVKEIIIEKTNEGNTIGITEIETRKGIISRLFTSFSIEPDNVERKGFYVYYNWKKELLPDETISIKITTNWILPFILVILIVITGVMSYFYFSTHVVIKKSVKLVRTKNDDFALRVQLKVKAKKFVENVRIYERLPGMTKVHEKFFGEQPSKLDRNNGRIQWNIPKLMQGEERVYTYLMYSKMRVIGRFELPQTTAIYDVLGKVHESKSNKIFFVNEVQNRIEEG